MHTVEFIPADWLERSAVGCGLRQTLLCLQPARAIERRVQTRRTSDVELLLKSLLVAKAA